MPALDLAGCTLSRANPVPDHAPSRAVVAPFGVQVTCWQSLWADLPSDDGDDRTKMPWRKRHNASVQRVAKKRQRPRQAIW